MTRVRSVTPADAATIRRVHVASIEAFGPEAYSERQVEAWSHKEGEPSIDGLDNPERLEVLAERACGENIEAAGFGRIHLDEAEIIAVYVHPDHTGLGVGSAILAHLEGIARGAGLDKLELTASLNAETFYNERGYRSIEHVDFETHGGVELECVRMEKALEQREDSG